MKQLTPLDSNFFFFEGPSQPMMLGSLWLCDQGSVPDRKLRFKQILQYIDDRLRTTAIFRWRLQRAPFEMDEPYWLEDKNFDLEYHVHHVGLPQPGDWNQLCAFMARSIARTVDMSRAPWEVWIIEGVNNVPGVPPGSFAVLLRFHHAYVDGKSSLALSVALMEETPRHEYANGNSVQFFEHPPTQAEMWLRTLPRLANRSLRMYRAGFDVAVKSSELIARMQRNDLLKPARVPRTIFNVPVTQHRTYGSFIWKLPELKRLRTLGEGASLNDVMIAIVAGGLRRYLLQHNALPPQASMVALCPVALRQQDTHYEGGNLVSAMLVPIGTDIEDPVERLEAVTKRTAAQIPLAKEVLYHLTNAAGDLYPAYMRALFIWIQNKMNLASKMPLMNTVITNVPGVPGVVPKYFAGAKILSVHPLLPIADGTALSHAITGIYEEVTLGVVADRQALPDMDCYIDCIRQATGEYLARMGTEAVEQKIMVVQSKTAKKPKPVRDKSPTKAVIEPVPPVVADMPQGVHRPARVGMGLKP